MAAKRITIHCLEIEDKPGSLQGLLAGIAAANIDLQGFVASSAGTGQGRIFLGAKDPAALYNWLKDSGIEAEAAAGFIVAGSDKVGAASDALKGLADADTNGIAGAAVVCDGQYRLLIVVAAADGDKAERVLG